jgi:hypothetical protein
VLPPLVDEQLEPLEGAALNGSALRREVLLILKDTSLPSFDPVKKDPLLTRTPDHPIGDMPLTQLVSKKIEHISTERIMNILENDFRFRLRFNDLLPPVLLFKVPGQIHLREKDYSEQYAGFPTIFLEANRI